jgi:hypothetical protein
MAVSPRNELLEGNDVSVSYSAVDIIREDSTNLQFRIINSSNKYAIYTASPPTSY